jgi:hypothetical protein
MRESQLASPRRVNPHITALMRACRGIHLAGYVRDCSSLGPGGSDQNSAPIRGQRLRIVIPSTIILGKGVRFRSNGRIIEGGDEGSPADPRHQRGVA